MKQKVPQVPSHARQPKILVVDDELDVLRSTQMLLERLGYRAVVLPEAEHLQAVIDTEQPDLILQDLVMPGLDLATAVGSVRASSHGASIPIVLFSASDDLPDRAAELDADGYLHKPFAEQQLRELLEQLLGPPPKAAASPEKRTASEDAAPRDREALLVYFHEYRNTLTALNNYAQFLLNSPNVREPEREATEEINRLLLDLEKRAEVLRSHLLGEK